MRLSGMNYHLQLLAKPHPPPGGAAFDRWVQEELSRAYDEALEEPVPESLLRLIREPAKGHG